MKRLMIGAAMLALLTSPAAMAQPRPNRGEHPAEARQHEGRQWHQQSNHWDNGRHRGWGRNRGANAPWGRGEQMGYNDWLNTRPVDYRRYSLRQPPRGYQWRRSHDRYILASAATGRIIAVRMVGGR